MNGKGPHEVLLYKLTPHQRAAVTSDKRRLLVVAGAGSGKTEIMARRIAWWTSVENVPKENIVAFTFTQRAADEMKFRIRTCIEKVTQQPQDSALGGMYVGTIHSFCLQKIKQFWPILYHNYDVLDEASRAALLLRAFNGVLALGTLRKALGSRQYHTVDAFALAYDLLHEHNQFRCKLPVGSPPTRLGRDEHDWCKTSTLVTDVGDSPAAQAFADSAARYYAYLHCRRFLDFSTSQTEFLRRLEDDSDALSSVRNSRIRLVVDEVQDINPVQKRLMEVLVGKQGALTVVGDHRQAIYGFRGAKVEIIGELWEEISRSDDAAVIDLQENFRSTARIIDLANRWAATVSPVRSMRTPDMKPGNRLRQDLHASHVALIGFPDRHEEAIWIAKAIRALVPTEQEGAVHDKRDGSKRGLALPDIAILVRSSTSVRTYMEALERAGISSVVRAGPDLFSQPEVLLFLSALAISGGQSEFYGSQNSPKSLPRRIAEVLGCDPIPEAVLRAAGAKLRASGLSFARSAEQCLLIASRAIRQRMTTGPLPSRDIRQLRTPGLRHFLTSDSELRRVFPQQLYHFLLAEAEVELWDTCEGRGQTAMFHLGALSSLITGLETPGWTSITDYPWQIIGLCQFGAEEGRADEQPLMVRPDAVTISTIHSVKGLEFAGVFLADVNAQRFPSSYARRKPALPLSGKILHRIDADGLADNENYDDERRLMYVALTRAERFLVISHSSSRTSSFIKELRSLVRESGGKVTNDAQELLRDLEYAPKEYLRKFYLRRL